MTFNNQSITNYASYQPRYDILPAAEYRTATQQPTYYFNQTNTYELKPILPEPQSGLVQNSIGYPFSKNVDLTKSEFTYIENAKSFGLDKGSFGLTNQ